MPITYGNPSDDAATNWPWSTVIERLRSARNYWIVSTWPDGRPHAVPVWAVWIDDTLYFSTDPSSRKGRNLAANPRVLVHLESGDEVVILEGRTEQLQDASALARFVDAYDAKYRIRVDTGNPVYAVYALRLELAHTWSEQAFPASAIRWRFTPE